MRRVALVLALLALGSVAWAQPSDWSVKRDPFDRTLIARYKQLLVRTPHDGLPLSALLSLYRRHRTVGLLVREYEDILEGSESAPTLIVLGRLARHVGQREHALELFTRAVRLDADDTHSWLAIGELRLANSERADARAAFARASETARRPPDKRAALRQLINATIVERDLAATSSAFDELSVLAPRDGRLWSERGDAELQLGSFTGAAASYKRAEELLARDPERRLLAIAARAHALDRAGSHGEAIAEYERAIATSPPGYYLRRDLVPRIIDVFRRTQSLEAAVIYLEPKWPEARRGAFEWQTLAQLYSETSQLSAMEFALHRAVATDPRDVTTQWKLIRHYDQSDKIVALSLLEVAAAASPRDVSLQLELAQRLWAAESQRRALAVAAGLSRALPRDVEAHRALAEVYARWNRPQLMLAEARKVSALEPSDDNLAMLGDALFAAAEIGEAIETWQKIARPGTPAALQRVAEIYSDHQMWDEAVEAYTKAMFGDDKNPQLWRGRAAALDELGRTEDAIVDATHAVKLLGPVPYDKGHDVRFRLVHIVTTQAKRDNDDDEVEPITHLIEWDDAFFGKRADRIAGYLLAEYYGRRPDERLLRVLERMHKLEPTDHAVVVELIRSYRQLEHHDKAIAIARWLAGRDPGRAADIAKQIAAIEREKPVVEARRLREAHDAEYFGAPCLSCRSHGHDLPAGFGLRLGLGDAWRGPTNGVKTLGAQVMLPLSDDFMLMTRVEWVGRDAVDAVGMSLGLAYPVFADSPGTVLVGAAYRGELRLGDPMTHAGYDTLGFAADATLDFVSRNEQIGLGLRFEQGISERARSSALFVEASFAVR